MVAKLEAIDRAHESNTVSTLFQLSNGSLVSSGKDEENVSIKVWNLADLSLLQTIDTDHTKLILTIDVSKDEAFLATASWGGSIKIWPIH